MSASLVGSEMCIRDSPSTPKTRISEYSELQGGTPRRCRSARRGLALCLLYRSTLPTICSV
eukprot:14494459-Alexandrium_andersonii.AAC.1